MSIEKKPVGIIIFGLLNCFLFGLLSFLVLVYLKSNPQLFYKMFLESMEAHKVNTAMIQEGVFENISVVSLIFPFFYILSGVGLLRGKEWGRKFTVFYAFGIVAITVVAVLLHRSFLSQAFFQIFYPGILLLYFTNRNVEEFFQKKEM
jgi:hypothetical protein